MIRATPFRRTAFLLAWLFSAVVAVAAPASDVAQNTPAASMALAQSLYATPTSGGQPASAVAPPTEPVSTMRANESSATPAKAEAPEGRESFTVFGLGFKITDTLLVLFTGLLWWSTHRLWNESRKGGKVAEMAANAAEVSAEAALRSAQVASGAEQPRWIVTSMTLHVNDTDGSTTDTACRVVAVLTNHGRTPAEVIRTAFQSRVTVLLDAKPRYAMGQSTAADAFGTTVVPPGGSYTVTLDTRVPKDDVEALRRGTTHLWAWGYLSYRTYLDEHMVKGFIGMLDVHPTRRLPLDQQDQPGMNYGHLIEGALRQPPADARVQAYVYTRPDPVGEAEATGVAQPVER